ncbi:MAG TPA: hypothetical protein VFW19_13965 [Allosphingosinicella sp.]|nr:hypothetical protein [Allosphingosinicella sp.]
MKLFRPSEGPAWLPRFGDSILSGFKSVMSAPFRPWRVAAADLPTASDYEGGIVWNTDDKRIGYSDGTAWRELAPAGDDAAYALRADNLSDLASAAAARTNLGLGTAATQNVGTTGATLPLLSTANAWTTDQSFSGLVKANGGGIAFPATQVASADPNTLDDYEEGSWTPALAFGGASTGVTYNTQAGRYTKVGRLVFIDVRILLTSKGSATGVASITGLPFIAAALPAATMTIAGTNFASTVTNPVCLGQPAATTLGLVNFAAGALSNVTDASFNNNTLIVVGGAYSVT